MEDKRTAFELEVGEIEEYCKSLRKWYIFFEILLFTQGILTVTIMLVHLFILEVMAALFIGAAGMSFCIFYLLIITLCFNEINFLRTVLYFIQKGGYDR